MPTNKEIMKNWQIGGKSCSCGEGRILSALDEAIAKERSRIKNRLKDIALNIDKRPAYSQILELIDELNTQ
jgi:hypothetical protein